MLASSTDWTKRRLLDADGPAVYAATGHLLFVRKGNLLAQDFDPERLETKGDPFLVAEHVTGGTALSASAAGPIAYRTPSADSGERQLVWVDRAGSEIERAPLSRHSRTRSVAFSRRPPCRSVPACEGEYGHLVVRSGPTRMGSAHV